MRTSTTPAAAVPGRSASTHARRYLTNREAAEFLRLSPRTLEKRRMLGGGPRYHKFGRRVVYAFDDLEVDHMLTKYADVEFRDDAECPLWLAFLEKIFGGNAEIIGYLQRAVGYSLTGDTREQCLHLLHGSGSNGKSTFLEVLQALMGDYGVQADFATFVEKKGDGPRNDVARLAGTRMVRSSEIGEGKRLNESLVKSLTGQDTIAARFLYSEAFEFRPTFKLWLAANHKPVIRGTDHAIWRRVRLIPFTVTISESEKDETLKDRLIAELPGILRWAVEGCHLWLERGLHPPDAVTVATTAYKNESDILGTFLEECCEIGSGLEVSATELYTAYKRWAHENGEFELSQTAFGRRIEERGFDVRKNGVKYRRGLRLVPNVVSRIDTTNRYGRHD